METDTFPYDIFQQVRFLVQVKGETLGEAVQEIESKLQGRLPEHIINRIKEEVENGNHSFGITESSRY